MRRLAVFMIVILGLGIGSAVAQPAPPAAPPPLRYEHVPPPPGSRFVWEPGHWHWNGGRYVWIDGHYIERHHGWGHYVPGRWVWRPAFGRWEWVAAHWMR